MEETEEKVRYGQQSVRMEKILGVKKGSQTYEGRKGGREITSLTKVEGRIRTHRV